MKIYLFYNVTVENYLNLWKNKDCLHSFKILTITVLDQINKINKQ